MSHCRERWLITVTLSLLVWCVEWWLVDCTMVDGRLAVLGCAAPGIKFLRIYSGNVGGRHIWRWGDRWLPSKEVGGSISSRSSGGDSLLIYRLGCHCHRRIRTQLCSGHFKGGRHAKRWGKGGISFRRKEGRVFSSSGKGYMVAWLDVVKKYLTSERTCREVGGWSFSSLKEGVADGERGCHLHIPNLFCV